MISRLVHFWFFVSCFCLQAQRPTAISLSPAEVSLAKNIGFDTQILLMLKMQHDAPLQHFYVEAAPVWEKDTVTGQSDQFFNGIMMNAPATKVDSILYELSDLFWMRGYHVFRTEDNFGNGPDQIGILKTNDPFLSLKVMGLDGINQGFDNQWVVRFAEGIFKRFPFHVSGVGREWMEGVFLEPPSDYLAFAQELAKYCPDIVDQGAGSVEALAKQMEESGMFYLWWD